MKKLIFSAMALLLVCAPAAQAKGRKHHNGGKYAMNSQMQQMKATQKAERRACKGNGEVGAGCADLKATQKEQRRELKRSLSGKGK